MVHTASGKTIDVFVDSEKGTLSVNGSSMRLNRLFNSVKRFSRKKGTGTILHLNYARTPEPEDADRWIKSEAEAIGAFLRENGSRFYVTATVTHQKVNGYFQPIISLSPTGEYPVRFHL